MFEFPRTELHYLQGSLKHLRTRQRELASSRYHEQPRKALRVLSSFLPVIDACLCEILFHKAKQPRPALPWTYKDRGDALHPSSLHSTGALCPALRFILTSTCESKYYTQSVIAAPTNQPTWHDPSWSVRTMSFPSSRDCRLPFQLSAACCRNLGGRTIDRCRPFSRCRDGRSIRTRNVCFGGAGGG